jgi:alcohol dehydrogenase
MRRLRFERPGLVVEEQAPDPVLQGPGEALVRPLAMATCDLDVAVLSGRHPLPGPFPLGHECVAEVVEVGADVRTVASGDRVVVPFQISCGTCARCRAGLTGSCTTVPFRSSYGLGALGGEQWGGVLADLARVPFTDAMLVALPAGVDPVAVASASDNLPDAWRAVAPHLGEDPASASVLVLGGASASIGLYAAGIAVALGAGRVTYADDDAGRLDLAERLGAAPVRLPHPGRLAPARVTVDASGDPALLRVALRALEPGGVCTSTAIYLGDTPVPLLGMYDVGVTFVTGRANARPTVPAVLDLVAGGFDPSVVTTTVAGWDEAAAALAAPTTKTVVTRT